MVMTPEQEAKLIDGVLRTYYRSLEWDTSEGAIKDALDEAEQTIRDAVLAEVEQELIDNCEAQACDVIRAMKGKTNEPS